jgi:hypothetical protein
MLPLVYLNIPLKPKSQRAFFDTINFNPSSYVSSGLSPSIDGIPLLRKKLVKALFLFSSS